MRRGLITRRNLIRAGIAAPFVLPKYADALSAKQVLTDLGGAVKRGPVPRGFVNEGDSITAGYGAITAPYPTVLANFTGLTTVNRGNAGDLLSGAGGMDAKYATDDAPYYNAATANTFVIWGGTNDIIASVALGTIEAALTSIEGKATVTGFKSVICTTLPRTTITGALETERLAYNSFIKANYASLGAYAVADTASIPEAADPTNLNFYLDGTHPTDALIGRITEVIREASNAPLVPVTTVSPSPSFTNITNALTASYPYTSNTVKILGITTGIPVTISGGLYSINGAAFTSSPGTLRYGDTIIAQNTSSPSVSTATTATITISGIPYTFTVTTASAFPPALVSTAVFGSGTLSNANRTAALAVSSTMRADTVLSGKKVFSVTLSAITGQYPGVGITTVGGNSGAIGFDGNRSIVYLSSGVIWQNGSNIFTGRPTYGFNQVGVVIDTSANRLWFTINGIDYYGSAGPLTATQVAAGTSGIDISAVAATGSMYPAIGTVSTATSTISLDTAYPWPIPSGASQY